MELTDAAIAELKALGEQVELDRGRRLFAQNDPPGPVALIEDGRFQISASSEDDVEVLLAVRRAREVIGEFAALDGLPRSATATALDSSVVTLIPAEQFVGWLREHPDVLFSLLVTLVGSVREADASRLDLSANEVDHRVVLRLCQLAHERGEDLDGGAVVVSPALTDEELAAFTGASAEAIERSLHRLGDLGVLSRTAKELMIHDPAALYRYGTT